MFTIVNFDDTSRLQLPPPRRHGAVAADVELVYVQVDILLVLASKADSKGGV